MTTPRLRLIAGRELSQKNLLNDLTEIITAGSADSVVVLITYDDGDHGLLASSMDRERLVYMLAEAQHDAICGALDEPPDRPEAS
jgi:hypothetical protein